MPQRFAIGGQRHIDAGFQGGDGENHRGAAQKAGDAVRRPVAGFELERRGVAHPARQRRACARLMAFGDEQKGGRAGAAVEILVAAADGEVGLGAVQLDRQRAGRMGDIPQRQRALGMRRRRQRRHVEQFAGAVVDVGQRHHRGVVVDGGGDFARRHRTQCSPARGKFGDTLGDIKIGGKITGLAENGAAPGPQLARSRQQFEQIDRRGIGDRDLSRCGADQARDLVADPLRQSYPIVLGPAAHQMSAPLVARDVGQPVGCPLRRRPQGIAAQIDQAIGQSEGVLERGQGVGRVEGGNVGVGGHGQDRHRIPDSLISPVISLTLLGVTPGSLDP